MTIRTPVDGTVSVAYRQIYVQADGTVMPPGHWGAGQSNGLCGAAMPGFLFLVTGLHTGRVRFTVEVHDAEPPIDAAWEEIVEASFVPESADMGLVEWGGISRPLGLAVVPYRVRYCATGMDAAHNAPAGPPGSPGPDSYLLQLWPAPVAADRVVKQTSASAAYWHDSIRTLPPPPTPEERAEAERRARVAREEAAEEARRRAELRAWCGVAPSERLRDVHGNTWSLIQVDRALLDALDEADDTVLRDVARWAARRAFELAGLVAVPWAAAALDACERGAALPPPFDSHVQVTRRLLEDPEVPHTLVSSLDGRIDNCSQQHAAAPALWAAAEADPLLAAIEAIHVATCTYGPRHRVLLDEVRVAFPQLRSCDARAYDPPPPHSALVFMRSRMGPPTSTEAPGRAADVSKPSQVRPGRGRGFKSIPPPRR